MSSCSDPVESPVSPTRHQSHPVQSIGALVKRPAAEREFNISIKSRSSSSRLSILSHNNPKVIANLEQRNLMLSKTLRKRDLTISPVKQILKKKTEKRRQNQTLKYEMTDFVIPRNTIQNLRCSFNKVKEVEKERERNRMLKKLSNTNPFDLPALNKKKPSSSNVRRESKSQLLKEASLENLDERTRLAFKFGIKKKKQTPIELISEKITIPTTSLAYQVWKILMIVASFSSSYHYAYMSGYLPEMEKEEQAFSFTVDSLYEIVFAVDLAMQFLVERHMEHQLEPERNLKHLAQMYMSSLQFFIDVITVIPFYEILPSFEFKEVVFLIKLFRLVNGFALIHYQVVIRELKQLQFNRIQKMITSDPKSASSQKQDQTKITHLLVFKYMLKALILVFILALLSYLSGILWYIMARLETRFREDSHHGHFDAEYTFSEKSISQKIIALSYFMFTSLSTVGLGDYHPKNSVERVFTAVLILFGVLLTSFTMENLMSMITQIRKVNVSFESSNELSLFMSTFKKYNMGLALPEKIEHQLEQYFEYRWRHNTNQAIDSPSDRSLLEQLPQAVQHSIFCEYLFCSFLSQYSHILNYKKQPTDTLLRNLFTKLKETLTPEQTQKYLQNQKLINWELDCYRDFMVRILQFLEPRKLKFKEIIQLPSREVNEIIFILNGQVEVGFNVNKLSGTNILPQQTIRSGKSLFTDKSATKRIRDYNLSTALNGKKVHFPVKILPGTMAVGLFEIMTKAQSKYVYRAGPSIKTQSQKKHWDAYFVRLANWKRLCEESIETKTIADGLKTQAMIKYITSVDLPLKQDRDMLIEFAEENQRAAPPKEEAPEVKSPNLLRIEQVEHTEADQLMISRMDSEASIASNLLGTDKSKKFGDQKKRKHSIFQKSATFRLKYFEDDQFESSSYSLAKDPQLRMLWKILDFEEDHEEEAYEKSSSSVSSAGSGSSASRSSIIIRRPSKPVIEPRTKENHFSENDKLSFDDLENVLDVNLEAQEVLGEMILSKFHALLSSYTELAKSFEKTAEELESTIEELSSTKKELDITQKLILKYQEELDKHRDEKDLYRSGSEQAFQGVLSSQPSPRTISGNNESQVMISEISLDFQRGDGLWCEKIELCFDELSTNRDFHVKKQKLLEEMVDEKSQYEEQEVVRVSSSFYKPRVWFKVAGDDKSVRTSVASQAMQPPNLNTVPSEFLAIHSPKLDQTPKPSNTRAASRQSMMSAFQDDDSSYKSSPRTKTPTNPVQSIQHSKPFIINSAKKKHSKASKVMTSNDEEALRNLTSIPDKNVEPPAFRDSSPVRGDSSNYQISPDQSVKMPAQSKDTSGSNQQSKGAPGDVHSQVIPEQDSDMNQPSEDLSDDRDSSIKIVGDLQGKSVKSTARVKNRSKFLLPMRSGTRFEGSLIQNTLKPDSAAPRHSNTRRASISSVQADQQSKGVKIRNSQSSRSRGSYAYSQRRQKTFYSKAQITETSSLNESEIEPPTPIPKTGRNTLRKKLCELSLDS